MEVKCELCAYWCDRVTRLAEKERWDMINPCPECQCAFYPDIRYNAIRFIYNRWCGLSPGMQAAIERLYPGGVDWSALFLQLYDDSNYERFVYLTQRGLLDPNGSHLYAEQILLQRGEEWEAQMEYYQSIGGNVNLQDGDGASLLATILMCQRMNLHHAQVDYTKRIRFLLDKGADPLLEDHSGMTALDFARDHMGDYPQTIHVLQEFL
jgi:hypothetical protein